MVCEIEGFCGTEALNHRQDNWQLAAFCIDLDDIGTRHPYLLDKFIRRDKLDFFPGWRRKIVLRHGAGCAIRSAGGKWTPHRPVEQSDIVTLYFGVGGRVG